MKPLLLIIRKKIRVPTKNQIVHQWRSDWKSVGRINYKDSFNLLNAVNNTGLIKTDAQFSKLLYDNYGAGIFHVNAWRKGHVGIISFFFVELRSNGFIRLKRNMSKDEKEKREDVAEFKRLKKLLANSAGEERIRIQREIEEMQAVISMDVDIISMTKPSQLYTSQYLTSTKPLYKLHAYENYGINAKQENNMEEVDIDIDSLY